MFFQMASVAREVIGQKVNCDLLVLKRFTGGQFVLQKIVDFRVATKLQIPIRQFEFFLRSCPISVLCKNFSGLRAAAGSFKLIDQPPALIVGQI